MQLPDENCSCKRFEEIRAGQDRGDPEAESHLEHCSSCQRKLDEDVRAQKRSLETLAHQKDREVRDRKLLFVRDLLAQHGYVLEPNRKIATGATSSIHVARDRNGNLRAIKILDTMDADRKRRFLRGAEAAQRIDHENVIRIHAVGTVETPFVVMELHESSVADLLLDKKAIGGRLPIEHALSIGADVARGLAKIHAATIYHCDLKPSNVLMNIDGRAVISDLDSSLKLPPGVKDSLTADLQGTPPYMSPQQISGETVEAASNLFSLGVLLYQMTTGVLPFGPAPGDRNLGRLVDSLQRVVFTRPRDLNPEIPCCLDSLILDLLEKHPRDRPASATDVADKLQRISRTPGLMSLACVIRPGYWWRLGKRMLPAGTGRQLIGGLKWLSAGLVPGLVMGSALMNHSFDAERANLQERVRAAEALTQHVRESMAQRLRDTESKLEQAMRKEVPPLDPAPMAVVGTYRPKYHSNIPGVLSHVKPLPDDRFLFWNEDEKDARWRKGIVFVFDRRTREFVTDAGPERGHFFESKRLFVWDNEGMWCPEK